MKYMIDEYQIEDYIIEEALERWREERDDSN
jgi:hypothetical protein